VASILLVSILWLSYVELVKFFKIVFHSPANLWDTISWFCLFFSRIDWKLFRSFVVSICSFTRLAICKHQQQISFPCSSSFSAKGKGLKRYKYRGKHTGMQLTLEIDLLLVFKKLQCLSKIYKMMKKLHTIFKTNPIKSSSKSSLHFKYTSHWKRERILVFLER